MRPPPECGVRRRGLRYDGRVSGEDQTTVRPQDRAEPPGQSLFLEVVAGARVGDRFELEPGTAIVGKAEDAEIRIVDSGVSRQHARVELDAGGRVTLFDLGSTNGTFVGNERVEHYVLGVGDRVHFGPDAAVRLVRLRSGSAKRAPELSARQVQLARLVAAGLTNVEIAERLEISKRTVASHLDHIYTRLDIRNRAQLTRWVLDRGLG